MARWRFADSLATARPHMRKSRGKMLPIRGHPPAYLAIVFPDLVCSGATAQPDIQRHGSQTSLISWRPLARGRREIRRFYSQIPPPPGQAESSEKWGPLTRRWPIPRSIPGSRFAVAPRRIWQLLPRMLSLPGRRLARGRPNMWRRRSQVSPISWRPPARVRQYTLRRRWAKCSETWRPFTYRQSILRGISRETGPRRRAGPQFWESLPVSLRGPALAAGDFVARSCLIPGGRWLTPPIRRFGIQTSSLSELPFAGGRPQSRRFRSKIWCISGRQFAGARSNTCRSSSRISPISWRPLARAIHETRRFRNQVPATSVR